MAEAPVELKVIAKTFEFVVWTCRHVAKFSRSHKFTLGDRLELRANCVLEGLIRARYDSQGRTIHLRQVNLDLELLRYQIRLARELHCLNEKSAGFAARSMIEIGQMVGGWLKNSKGRN